MNYTSATINFCFFSLSVYLLLLRFLFLIAIISVNSIIELFFIILILNVIFITITSTVTFYHIITFYRYFLPITVVVVVSNIIMAIVTIIITVIISIVFIFIIVIVIICAITAFCCYHCFIYEEESIFVLFEWHRLILCIRSKLIGKQECCFFVGLFPCFCIILRVFCMHVLLQQHSIFFGDACTW